MTKKRRRIRLRRISIIRPYAVMLRTPTTNKIQKEKKTSTNTTTHLDSKEPSTQTSNKNTDSIASFDSEQNPYAYLVSQLPSMLSAIPNLVQQYPIQKKPEIPQTPINNNTDTSHPRETTQSIKRQALCLLEWKKPPTQSPLTINTLLIKNDQSKTFLWPGLPEQSCRQIRFGASVNTQRNHQKEKAMLSHSLHYQLKRFAKKKCHPVVYLCLLHSSVEQVRNYLLKSTVKNINSPIHSLEHLPLHKLKLQAYFTQAFAEGHLHPSTDYIAGLLPLLKPIDEDTHCIHSLAQQILKVNIPGGYYLVKIRSSKQEFYFEMFNKDALLYLPFSQPIHCGLNQCLYLIKKRMPELTQNKGIFSLYAQTDDFNNRLEQSYSQALKRWQPYLQQAFYQFVSSQEPNSNFTKLN